MTDTVNIPVVTYSSGAKRLVELQKLETRGMATLSISFELFARARSWRAQAPDKEKGELFVLCRLLTFRHRALEARAGKSARERPIV